MMLKSTPKELPVAAGHLMNKERVVFDCNVYLQFLLNSNGASGQCVLLALRDEVELFVSAEVVQEIVELPSKRIGIERGLTDVAIQGFVEQLLLHAHLLEKMPVHFIHPIDPDDSVYVNLAIAANAKLIVSSDKHLLNLNNPLKPWSQAFREQYSDVKILRSSEYLDEFRRRVNQP